ncbi:MAG: type II toxin-antitoxin system VapC family toxin [Treponema sp.]|jgi:predicted nucleic acid-binding protein|nr:type II toxin-antitoxin system VapC family toxin [Treponema sp.]
MTCVLDACALITYLNGEPGKEIMRDLFRQAVDRKMALYMSVVNMIEVRYGYIRDMGPERAQHLFEQIQSSPITIIHDISNNALACAARLKASYSCSLADAIGIATAIELSAQFVTSDHKELEAVEKAESLSVLWLPPHPKK